MAGKPLRLKPKEGIVASDPTLNALNTQLDNLTIRRKLEMTKVDYDKLMSIKNRLRELISQEDGLNDEDKNCCQGLIMCAYRDLNKMEEYYENNGNKWAA